MSLLGASSSHSSTPDQVGALSPEDQSHLVWGGLIATTALQIRQSSELGELLQTTVDQVRQLLGCDRALIYQFAPDWSGEVAVEAVSDPRWSLLHQFIHDPCFQTSWFSPCQEERVFLIEDVATANLTPCHADFLTSLQVQANLVVPVFDQDQLWGLLVVHSCTAPRSWSSPAIAGLEQLAVHVGIAIHQAALVQQLQAAKTELERQKAKYVQEANRLQQATQALKVNQQRFQSFMDNAPILSWVVNRAGQIEYGNLNWLAFNGHTEATVLGKSVDDLFPPEFAEIYRQNHSLVFSQGQVVETIEQGIAPDGSLHSFLVRKFPAYQADHITAVGGIAIDITAQKQTEALLRDQAETLRIFYDTSSLMMGLVEISADDILHLSDSPAALAFFGKPADQVANHWASDIGSPPEVIQRWLHHYRQSQQQQCPIQFDYEHQSEDSRYWLLVTVTYVGQGNSGRPRFSYVVQDLSAKKQLEAERQRAEAIQQRAETMTGELKLLENIFELIRAGYWDWDIPGQYEYLSAGFKHMFGYDDDELPNSPETWQQLIVPDDLPIVLDCSERHIQSHGVEPYYYEVRYRHKNGSTVWVMCSGQVVEWDADGNPLRMIGCHIDITQRKQFEERLRQSEATNRAILMAIPDLLLRVGRDGMCYDFLPPTDTHASQFLPVRQHLSEVLSPDLLAQQLQGIETALSSGIPQGWEQQLEKHGQLCDEEVRIVPCGNDQCLVIVRDITDRKHTEATLRQSEATNRALIQAIPDFLVRMRQDGLQLEVINQGAIHCLRPTTNQGDIPNHRVTNIMPSEIAQERIRLAQRAITTGEIQRQEYDFIDAGQTYHEEARITPLCGDEVLVMVRDITEQKQSEAQLRNLSTRLKLAVRSAQIGIWDWDVVNDVLTWDDRMCAMYGITSTDFSGAYQAWEAGVHPADLAATSAALQQALAGEKEFDTEFRIVWPDGSIHFIKAFAIVQRNVQDDPLRMIGVNFDITDRQQAELDLKSAKDQLELFIQATSEGFWDWDMVTNQIYFSPRWKEMLGYADHELDNTLATWESVIFAEDYAAALQLIDDYNSGRANCFSTVQRFHHKNGGLVYVLSRAIHLKDDQDRVVRMVGSHLDVTSTVNIQEALKTSKMQLSSILNSSLDGIMAFQSVRDDLRGTIIDFEWLLSNPTACEIVGQPAAELIGKRLLEEMPGNRDDGLFDLYVQVVETGDPLRRQFHYCHEGVDSWIETIAVKLGDGFAVTFRDITVVKQSELALQQANQEMELHLRDLKQRNDEMLLLSETSDFLQACRTIEEACSVITTLVKPLFPDCAGGFFITSESRHRVENVAAWGDHLHSQTDFHPHDCWALRRGRWHQIDPDRRGLRCNHIAPAAQNLTTLCIPMIAQGETLGLFYLNTPHPEALGKTKRQLARTVAEQVGLSIANLRLRETLQHQSIRDPLTGLFNRRYLEETLQQEIARAQRNEYSIGVIMLDVDHFKQFNDTYGHDAGDFVLQTIGQVLKDNIRGSDIACRYGGEEMTLVFPETTPDEAQARAEQLRQTICQCQINYNGQVLNPLTASLGLASFPIHGATGAALIQSADAALYRAKAAGRNQVIIAP